MNFPLEAATREVERLKNGDHRIIVAVDGRCASGKTTFARSLSERLGCAVFHLDDFFLRPEQRTRERLETAGENVDHERFLCEVLGPLRRGDNTITYRPFDCSTASLSEPIPITVGDVAIVEGSYSCHPELWANYDLRVFLTVSEHEQMKRITDRNGADAARKFRDLWIPLEEKYFAAYDVENRYDLRCSTDPFDI